MISSFLDEGARQCAFPRLAHNRLARRGDSLSPRPHYLPPRCFYCVKPATVTRGAIRKGLFHASGDRFSSYGSGGARGNYASRVASARFQPIVARRRATLEFRVTMGDVRLNCCLDDKYRESVVCIGMDTKECSYSEFLNDICK